MPIADPPTWLALAGAWLAACAFAGIASRPYAPKALIWLACMALGSIAIVRFSGGSGGADVMKDWFARFFGLEPGAAGAVVWAVRKSIHFCFYGALGLVSYRWARSIGCLPLVAASAAFAFTALHAVFDEWSQGSVLTRSSSAYDMLLDLAGFACFVGLASGVDRRKARSLQPEPKDRRKL